MSFVTVNNIRCRSEVKGGGVGFAFLECAC